MWELIPLLVCNALRQSRKQPSLRCLRQGICPLHIQIGKEMHKTILPRLFHFESFDLFLSVFQGDLCRDSFLVQEEHQTLHERIELHKGTDNFRRTKEANLCFSKVPRQNSTFLVLLLPQFFPPSIIEITTSGALQQSLVDLPCLKRFLDRLKRALLPQRMDMFRTNLNNAFKNTVQIVSTK